MSNRLLLSPKHQRILEALLREHMPDVEVWAYGSRVNGRGHEGSDLDLVLRGSGLRQIPLDQLVDFEDAVRESNIPFLVEARDWARLPERFHREIEGRYVVLCQSDERRGSREWSRKRLGDCMELGDESYRTTDDWAFVNYLETGSIKEGRVSAVKHLVVGEDKIPSRARRKVRYGDIVYSTVRPNQRHFGLLKEIPPNFLVSTGFCVMRGHPNLVDTRFLYWFLAQDRVIDHLQTIAEHSVSAYPSIRPSDIESLEIRLPCMAEQRAIAHILGTLDEKIELNHRMNETLEAMARVLFKSWFVDFDPVRAKMEGQDTGLPKHMANLFPGQLVKSELGKIPEGWAVKKLKDCMNLTMGQSPPGSTYNDRGEGLPFFQGRSDFGSRYVRKRRFCSTPTRVALPEDTLVSVRAPVGDINMAWEKCCIGRGVAALRHKSGSSSFTYYLAWAMQREIKEYEHNGTVFGAINKGQFENLMIIDPDPNLVATFDSISASLDRQIRMNISESRALIAFRDTLLPQLISGELRVQVTEKSLGGIQ